MSPEDFTRNVITMNEEKLSENILEQILHYLPTMEQLNNLNDVAKITPNVELNQAEKFFIAVCGVITFNGNFPYL